MDKKFFEYEKLDLAKEKLSSLPDYILKSTLNSGDLTKETNDAIIGILKERRSSPPIDNEISQAFFNNSEIEYVNFRYNDYILIYNGYERGKYGSIISLISLLPEPIYLVELEGNEGDRQIPQSSIRIAK